MADILDSAWLAAHGMGMKVAYLAALLAIMALFPTGFAVGGGKSGGVTLSVADRAEIEKYLGSGFLGRQIADIQIGDPSEFLRLADGRSWVYKEVVGSKKGETGVATLRQLNRSEGQTAWRFDHGDVTVQYGQIDDDGSFMSYSSEDRGQGVISRYDPPQPMLMAGMDRDKPIEYRVNVNVFDLARPDKKKHEGYLDLEHRYLGSYRVTAPAGEFDAALFKWDYDGKIGPARVKDTQYWFMAEGIGPVAMIDSINVSAFLVYNDNSKKARVLVSQE